MTSKHTLRSLYHLPIKKWKKKKESTNKITQDIQIHESKTTEYTDLKT